jgi:hypothetical protein
VSWQPVLLAVAAVSLVALTPAACSSASASSGLSSGCTGGSTSSIRFSVVDDTNESEAVCDATVTVTGSGETVTLTRDGSQGDCTYVGNVTKAGTFSATVTAPNYATQMSTLTVQLGCSYAPSIEVSPL